MEVLWWVVILGSLVGPDLRVRAGNPDAKRLYDDLLSNYNKLVRPVVNVSEAVTVRLKLKLSQLIDVVSPYYTVREETMQYTDLMTCNIQCSGMFDHSIMFHYCGFFHFFVQLFKLVILKMSMVSTIARFLGHDIFTFLHLCICLLIECKRENSGLIYIFCL